MTDPILTALYGTLYGVVIGLIIGIPVAALIILLLDSWWERKLSKKEQDRVSTAP